MECLSYWQMDIDRLLSRSQSLAQSKGKGGDK